MEATPSRRAGVRRLGLAAVGPWQLHVTIQAKRGLGGHHDPRGVHRSRPSNAPGKGASQLSAT